MIDRKKFDKLVKEYQNYFTNHKGENGESYWEEEEFKWRGIKTFQDNWDIEAEDLSDMIKRSLNGVSHMMVSQARFPEGMIEGFAEQEPDTVRAMFKDLFDESKDIVERFHSFKQKSADLLERVGNGAKNHFQDERTIALYLWLRYPDKYYVYQYTQARNLSIALGSDHRIIKGRLDSNIREWLALYNEVTELMKQKPEVRSWETQGMTAEHYPDPEYRMLATDLAYCYTERILKEQKAEQEWEPKDYNPGITVENWVSLLTNNEVYYESAKTVIERLLDYGGQATCTQLAQKYGDNANTYNVNSIAFAKKVYEKTHCKLAEREDESVRWWSILYMGKKADKDDDGVYIWKLRPELAEALKIVNGEEVPDEDTDTTEYTKKDFLEEVFISEAKYDEMYAVLMRKQNIILQGAPGVGKTFAAKRLAYSIMGAKNDDHIQFVQFHQNYSYEDFVEGYRPAASGFVRTDGIFKRFCIDAADAPDEKFFFIIDEINRGNLSKIFGELLMLIEKDYRGQAATLPYSGRSFTVPKNLYIIGMMNTADRSLAMIDYALRRRFSFVDMEPGFDTDGFKEYMNSKGSSTMKALVEEVKQLNVDIKEKLGKGFCIGHSYFVFDEPCSDALLKNIVNYDILPMLAEYWFDDEEQYEMWASRLNGVFENGSK
jgi:5-methylcytosine-specific restriction protein B